MKTVLFSVAMMLGQTASAITTATLTPTTVAPGSAATLRITTDTEATPQVSGIPGAQMYSRGQSSEISVYNGAVTRRATYTYQIVPEREGTLILGPYRVGPDTTQALSLMVSAKGAGAPKTAKTPKTSSGRPGRERAFLSLWLGDDTPYVGQSVPVTVSAYLRDDVGGTLEGVPALAADDFLLDGMDEEPTRTQVTVKGSPYTRFTWTASLTPVRAGTYPLTAELPATLQWVEQRQTTRRRRRGSLFDELIANDPFLRNSGFAKMFGDMGSMGFSEPEVRSAHVQLRADHGEIQILTPPAEGHPADFVGAVGEFSLKVLPLAAKASVGEPVELSWEVTGSGNISTLTMAGLAETDRYRTYSPERQFEPTVRSKTKGKVVFTQLVVPKEEGELSLGELSLSYFDAKTETYKTLTEALPSITVTASGAAGSAKEQSEASRSLSSQSDEESSSPQVVVLPMVARHGVWAVGPLAALGLLLAWLFRFFAHDSLESGWKRARALWRRRALQRAMRASLRSDNPEGFFRAGLALVRTELGEDHPDGPAGVRSFVSAADRSLYGREAPDLEELTVLFEELITDLRSGKEAA